MKYIPTTKRILGVMCLKADYAGVKSQDADLILFGKFGMIWQHSPGKYMVVCDSAKVANKRFALTDKDKIRDGEEYGRVLAESEALQWLKWLRVPNSRPGQSKIAKEKYGW